MKASSWPEGGCVDGNEEGVGGGTGVRGNCEDCASVVTDLRERFKEARKLHERLAPKGASPRWDELARLARCIA